MYKNSISRSGLDFSELSRGIFEPYFRRYNPRTHLLCKDDACYVPVSWLGCEVAPESKTPADSDQKEEKVGKNAEDGPG